MPAVTEIVPVRPTAEDPARAATIAERAKVDKHAADCRQQGMAFAPFGMDVYGNMAASARQLSGQLAEAYAARQNMSLRESLPRVLVRISMALQRAVAASMLCRVNR